MIPWRRLGVSAVVLSLALMGGASWVSLEPDSIPGASLGIAEQFSSAAGRRVVIPSDPGPLSPAQQLEARLAALAAAVERRDQPLTGLIEFDVLGLNETIDDVLGEIRDQAEVSVHVRDLETQHVLFDYYGDTPLNPASNQKLLTTSAAIDLLGSDYVFETRVARHGSVLYLVGGGDPTLNTYDLAALAEQVAQTEQLGEIERLVVDDTAFSPERFGPGYSAVGPGYAYEAPSGALTLNFNTVEVRVFPVRGSRRLAVTVDPPSDHVEIKSVARTGRRNTLSIGTYERDGHTVVDVRGQYPRRGRPVVVRRRVVDPGRFAGATFAAQLGELTASEPLKVDLGAIPVGTDVVVTHQSAPLIEVVDAGLAYSNNTIAEQILRTLAWRMTGKPGDWETGLEILRDYWNAVGNSSSSIVLENASGLSQTGRVTTSGIVDLISVAHRVHPDSRSLIDALPVAGEPGTLRSRLRISGKRVRAKTGTFDGVSALSGVVTREDGMPQIAFSILVNARDPELLKVSTRKRVEDLVVLAVLRFLDDYQAKVALLAPN